MELDELLSQMNRDVEQTISGMNNMFNGNFAMNNETNVTCNDAEEEFLFCPECGTKLPAGSKFCSNCGTRIESMNSDDEKYDEDYNSVCHGIIMTDSSVLADKYGEDRDYITSSVRNFISNSENFDVYWLLLDIADYQKELGEGTWMDYSDVLDHFMKEFGIKNSPKLSLFIIGGNDVIPQPAEKNPCGDAEDEYQEFVYADFYYCFYGKLPLDFLDFNKARCNVARLPLEMSKIVNTSFDDDVLCYLNKCIDVMEDGGISIGNAVMTSNVDWIPASREMSRNLPTPHMDDVEGETLDNMYLSPGIMAEGMNDELEEQYFDSLSEADMLMFNLHGACSPEDNGFYSSGLAFSIDMLSESNAKVFNTVACWGGRYIKYQRKDSMLLNAIYNNDVMLYSGSCVPALGKCGNYQSDSTWRIQPAAYSETFMARFAEYECIGTMPAGEAFLKAKCDYYNSSRSIEEDECILGTVLMFNLYGCPLLRTNPDVDAIEQMQEEDGSKIVRIPFRKMQKQVVMKSSPTKVSGSVSLLEEVRGAVDANLSSIHKAITENLYNVLGVEPRELYSVEKFTTTDAYGMPQKGYIYNYRQKRRHYITAIRAKVDERGNILDTIQTK